MNDHASPSSDAIAAAFPHTVLERVNGTPGREEIDDAQEKQTENAASRPSTRGGGNHGHAGMVVPLGRYVVEFNPTAYEWEPNPGEAPAYPDGVVAAPARILNNNFARAQRIFREQSGTHTALKNQLYRKYNSKYWTGLVQPGTGIATVSLIDMYAHLYVNYGQITDANLEDARLGITSQFDFATLPMKQYLFKVRKCQQPHGNAIPPRPITDEEAMGIVYLNLQRSG